MKKFTTLIAVLVLFSLPLNALAASFELLALHDNITIQSIDSIRIIDTPRPTLRILATFKNESERTVRMKNGDFMISIVPDKNFKADEMIAALGVSPKLAPDTELILGNAKIGAGKTAKSKFAASLKHFELQSNSETKTILEIQLPPSEPERHRKITHLINYIGLPGAFKHISMIGKTTIGIGGAKGWAYQDLSLLELYYVPTMQSQVLFR